MFFKIVNDGDGYARVQVTLGHIKRSFTVRQFMVRVTGILNTLGYEVKEKNSEIDSVNFMSLYGEMCSSHLRCDICPIAKAELSCSIDVLYENAEKIYELVDRWKRENRN